MSLPRGRSPVTGVPQGRTVITPFHGEGVEGRGVQ